MSSSAGCTTSWLGCLDALILLEGTVSILSTSEFSVPAIIKLITLHDCSGVCAQAHISVACQEDDALLGGSFNGHVELGRIWAGSSKVTFACLANAVHHICNRCDTTHDPAGDPIFLTWHLWRRPKICMLKLAFLRFHANQR